MHRHNYVQWGPHLQLRKKYHDAKEGLLAPSGGVLAVLEQVESDFRSVATSVMHMNKVRTRIVRALSKNNGESLNCVDCDRKWLIVNIFVNIRLHHCLRENNRNLGSHKGRRNRKVMKFSHN